jgi:acetyl-CoA carboxylase carboxyl transferase subunit alpha
MAGEMQFELPLIEKRKLIEETKQFAQSHKIDLNDKISVLESEYSQLEQEIYENLQPYHKMQIARHAQRPTTSDLIQELFTDYVELHGDRLFRDDLAIVGGIAKLNDIPVTVVGHQKGKDTKDNVARHFGMPHPEGFRKALRLMQQANKFNRPIITFIDTPGAYPGNAAEERGQGEAIARNLKAMASFGVPIISIVVGEGGSGGALALGVGNRVLMLEHAIYSVSSPEAAASILWKDASQNQRAAEAMKITSKDMLELKVIDDIIPEPRGGAHRDVPQSAAAMKEVITMHLEQLLQMSPTERIEDRFQKFRKIGAFKI